VFIIVGGAVGGVVVLGAGYAIMRYRKKKMMKSATLLSEGETEDILNENK